MRSVSQPAQRGLRDLADVLGPAVGADELAAFEAEAELGREDHLVAPPLERSAEQLLVGEGAVGLGGVEEGDAELDGSVERRDGFLVVGHAVGLAHSHAAEAEGGDLESLASELAGREHFAVGSIWHPFIG